MGAIDFVKEAEEIAEKNLVESKEITKKKVLTQKILKFISNEDTKYKQNKLLNFIKQVNWYWASEIEQFFNDTIEELVNSDSLFVVKARNASSSGYNTVSCLANMCIIEENSIKAVYELEEKDNSNYDRIFILDDYIGSGDTIIKNIIPNIEKIFESKEVYIISYICHEKGYDNIRNTIEGLKNKYNIINKIIENNYKNKLDDEELVEYIDEICKSCKDNDYAFGYNATGAMMILKGLSPNNNLSLIWRNDIKYKQRRWLPLIDRNINFYVLERRKLENIDKNKNLIKINFNRIKNMIEYEDFLLLILVYNCCNISSRDIEEFKVFDNIEETNIRLNKLKENGIITIECGYIEIINKDLLNILRIIEGESIRFKKKTTNSFTTKNSP